MIWISYDILMEEIANQKVAGYAKMKVLTVKVNKLRLFIAKFLPLHCEIYITPTSSVIASSEDNSQVYDMEENFRGVSLLFFPCLPGISVDHACFKLKCNQCYCEAFNSKCGLCDMMDSKVLPSEYDDYETTPCFVHLAYYMERPLEVGDDDDYDLTCSRIIKNIGQRVQAGMHATSSSYTGGVMTSLHEDAAFLQMLRWRGRPLTSVSLKLPPSLRTRKQLQTTMERFKESIALPVSGRCVAFIHQCIARGVSLYRGPTGVESLQFHDTFPGIPLFGNYTAGEFGAEVNPTSRPISKQTFSYEYTSFISILSW